MKDKQQKESQQLGNSPEDESSSIGVRKKGGIRWLKKLLTSPGAKIPEARTIQSLIQQKSFHDAVKKLIVIENTVSDDVPLHNKTEDINSLYESLEKEMFQVILDSIVQIPGDSLIQVIKAIKKREKEDFKILKKENVTGHRRNPPRKWKEKWMKWIETSVSQQISNAQSIATNETDSCLSEKFCNLGKTFKNDLIHAVKNLSPHYPEEFNVCNLYAQHYHKTFVSEIGSLAEYELAEEDTYFLLCWIHNIYPQTILRDPAVQGHIDESKLESLLPLRMILNLEKKFVNCEVNTLETFLENNLDLEAKRWKDAKEPVTVGDYQSKLQTDVSQMYRERIQRAAEVSEEMSLKMASHLENKLQKFLIRYQSLVVEYTQNQKKQKQFKTITIANINCSWAFRNFLEDKDLRIERRVKENLSLILREFETLGYDALLQDTFGKLKSHFSKLRHGNDRKQTFSDIMECVKSCVTSLKTLCQPCFQVMIGKMHFQVVLEYITQLMENPVRFENLIQLRTVANQMAVNASCINRFFSSHGSQETWLNPLLEKLAEIIKLESLQDIIHEISKLATKYTDLGIEHIIAILHIKGNLDRPQAKSAVKQIQHRMRSRANRANCSPLFSLIKPFSSEWLLCKHHESSCGCARLENCIFKLYMKTRYTFNMAVHFCCKKFNMDTPPKFYPHKPAQTRSIIWD